MREKLGVGLFINKTTALGISWTNRKIQKGTSVYIPNIGSVTIAHSFHVGRLALVVMKRSA